MSLPTGLVPVLVFVLTVGISVPVTLAAQLFHRNGAASFGTALRAAVLEAGLLYLVGVVVIWSIAGGGPGGPIWGGGPATLVVTGIAALLMLIVLPLLVGRHLVRHWGAVDPETALRYATYGWPLAMLVVFGLFVAPGGLGQGHLLDLGGERICLAGFCGIAVSFAGAVLLEVLVAVFGPGLVGLLVASRRPVPVPAEELRR